jgi:hypothetical protein
MGSRIITEFGVSAHPASGDSGRIIRHQTQSTRESISHHDIGYADAAMGMDMRIHATYSDG